MRGRFVDTSLLVALLVMASVVPAGAGPTGEPDVLRFDDGGYDRARALAVDSAGNLYLAGAIDKANSSTAFAVTKLGPAGAVNWTTHYGGSQGGVGGSAEAVALDAAGNVYVAGIIGDGVIFNTNWDYLVMKVAANGTEQWARRYDGPAQGFDRAGELAVDAAGGVYVSGFSYGQNYDWTTLKYNANGTLAWERRHGGPGAADDRVADMTIGPDGNLVVTGSTQPTGDGMTNDVETLKYDPSGNVVWHRRWTADAASHEFARDLDIDASGGIAITGTTAADPSPYTPPFPFTLRYGPSGSLFQVLRDTNAGGAAVDLDADGNAYLAGTFFATEGASSIAKYDAAGALVWSAPLAVGSDDAFGVVAIAADSTGAVTLAGSVVYIFNGSSDYLTIRYDANGAEQWRYRFAGTAGGQDQVAGLAVAPGDDALVTGTSWNDYGSIGGTADDIVTLRFAAGAAPAMPAPTNLTARASSATDVRLAWSDNSGTEDGFRIERCTGVGCTAFTPVATVGHDVTTYVDGGRRKLTTYGYRVQAFNADGASAYTNIASAKTKRR